MTSFAEFEAGFLGALQQERSDLQGLHGTSEAQLSAWIEHLFREYLGYTHWKEISRGEGTPIGSKGGKQLFPDLRIDILDNGLIFIECKRLGRLDGPKGQEELDDGVSQLKAYIRAHLDRASIKPKTVLGVVTDGNRWVLLGLNKTNEFHTIAEWAFLTDDPRLIAQRLWLLAKPALAQPTSALVEFLARRTLAEVLRENTKWLTRKVNEKLPDGAVSEDLLGKWLRDAFSDPAVPSRLVPGDSSSPPGPEPPSHPLPSDIQVGATAAGSSGVSPRPKRSQGGVALADLIAGGILTPPLKLFRKYKGKRLEATLLGGGAVEFQGQRYDTCSGAAEAARATVSGRRMNTNGWTFWQYQGADGKKRTLRDARHRVLPAHSEDTSGQKGRKDKGAERYGLRKKFWEGLLARAAAKTPLHAKIAPAEGGWLAAGSGVRGLPFVYVIKQEQGKVELWIDRGAGKAAENKRIFDSLEKSKDEIERAFEGKLSWERLEGKQSCRIAYITTVGGYKSHESKWPEIQDAMIDPMIRLEKALAPHLEKMKTDLAAEGA
jgi:hypothetical protein